MAMPILRAPGRRLFAVALGSIPVAVVTLAVLGRRRPSRPVGYAIGNIGFPFPGTERRENATAGSPAGRLDPLGCGKCRGREKENQTDDRNELHGGCLIVILEAWHGLA